MIRAFWRKFPDPKPSFHLSSLVFCFFFGRTKTGKTRNLLAPESARHKAHFPMQEHLPRFFFGTSLRQLFVVMFLGRSYVDFLDGMGSGS